MGEPFTLAQIDLDRAISDIAEQNWPVVRHLTFQGRLRENIQDATVGGAQPPSRSRGHSELCQCALDNYRGMRELGNKTSRSLGINALDGRHG
jgi:hypothetical protein